MWKGSFCSAQLSLLLFKGLWSFIELSSRKPRRVNNYISANSLTKCMCCGMSYRDSLGVFTLSGQQIAIVLSQSDWLIATAAR